MRRLYVREDTSLYAMDEIRACLAKRRGCRKPARRFPRGASLLQGEEPSVSARRLKSLAADLWTEPRLPAWALTRCAYLRILAAAMLLAESA